MFYNPKVLGPFCESLDPQLAFIAYKKGAGECDDDLIRISHAHGLYRDLAKYLVERQDLELWAKVLIKDESEEKEDPQRRQLIDQIVEWALPESTNADEVSCTVKAFMAADLPGELIVLLERIVLQGSDPAASSGNHPCPRKLCGAWRRWLSQAAPSAHHRW